MIICVFPLYVILYVGGWWPTSNASMIYDRQKKNNNIILSDSQCHIKAMKNDDKFKISTSFQLKYQVWIRVGGYTICVIGRIMTSTLVFK